ncbi:hypothetical protein KUCAC02_024995 [Chaenocephalus aceratus]|nr:hypothetical protein KUCAC02_024995 [Chaenocephalus aceratus]
MLTEKQKLRVKKIFENEKRLTAGEPLSGPAGSRTSRRTTTCTSSPCTGSSDSSTSTPYLTHSELSPLRAPLIPMEHCTTRFFEECDADNDKYIALEEWSNCFGIKEQDVDKDLIV